MRVEVAAPAGYLLHGSCGERLAFGVSEVLQPASLPSGACDDYRDRALASFGRGGRRVLVDHEGLPMAQTPDDNWLPEWGMGRRPRARTGGF